jgi:F-type H+-transporting ATPase subunit epsilon
MAKEFKVRVLTPEKLALEGTAVHVQFPGLDGLYGVLAGHAPLITPVAAGPLSVRRPNGQTEQLFVAEGFAEVRDNTLRLVCDASERPIEIDLERAREAEKRARERLAKPMETDFDLRRAERALRRALWRERIAAQRG